MQDQTPSADPAAEPGPAIIPQFERPPASGGLGAPPAGTELDRRYETLPPAPVKDGYVDRFGGKLVLVLLDDKEHPSIRGGRSLWALERPLTYKPSNRGDTITVPAGAVTDLASIPRFAWSLLPPDGPWVKAAVVHDFLYRTEGTGVIWAGHEPGVTKQYDRSEADFVLRDGMQNRGVDVIRRNIIWAAVRLFGGWGWGH
ncbi:DUF1353 domain-containing protein [Phenylobacterium sp.]|uniref:DUF1353 domain-containing protein n=1 Tax=Phenylobacterium sp. TaxID=1871053 RepID=UPI001224693D|nr:DUF1353 domain-containing protein [Phenylobacterium sp.]THD60699.1 MAG: DUF1353 domain-containing protein [Phenylobacterium sp.]